MKKQRIAVVSTDGIAVNEHFGRADHFLIYDLGQDMNLVEKRETERLSVGDPNHSFDPDKFGRVSSILNDCSKVYVTHIGDMPAAKLRGMGIEPVVYEGDIMDILN